MNKTRNAPAARAAKYKGVRTCADGSHAVVAMETAASEAAGAYTITPDLEGSDYGDGILLDKYGDRYSLVAAQKSQKANGTIYKRWAFPQDKDKKPREKAVPMGVKLGNRIQAVGMLRAMLAALDKPTGTNDGIPF